ncbi:MAG: glyoxalase/bleomycin resistance protein/dioxygenase [Ilumatobacteraceae bacterium]|nr:glyoxalase/bleomycin resistance protein/dioxygenase [Ilumatobacteraceae bacterium]
MKPVRAVEVCIDVVEPEPVATFWSAFLGYTASGPLDARWVNLVPPAGLPVLNLQRVPEEKAIKNRLHLDVFVDDPEDWIEHATTLGAATVHLHDDDADWFCVMADPAGNEFCICREATPSG